MGRIRSCSDFLLEKISKSLGELKRDELWDKSNEDAEKYEDLCNDFLSTINVDLFIKKFDKFISDRISDYMKGHYDSEHNSVNDCMYGFDAYMDNDDEYGSYGINVVMEESISVYAFMGDMDITDTDLGKKIVKIIEDTADEYLHYLERDDEDDEDTRKIICKINGWQY